MPSGNGFGINLTISDFGARFGLHDYCSPMVMGCAVVLSGSLGIGRTDHFAGVNYAGLMADNLSASFFPDLVNGTALGLLFPLYIHLSDRQSSPVFPLAPRSSRSPSPDPYGPSPYATPATTESVSQANSESPWNSKILEVFPCPRPVTTVPAETHPAFRWSDGNEGERPSDDSNSQQEIRQKCGWSPQVLVARAGEGKNKIRQTGGTGGDRLIASAGSGSNEVTQKAGWGPDKMVTTLGHGDNQVQQKGSVGNDDQRARLGHGNNNVEQDGGWGDDRQVAVVGDGHNRIHQDGGRGDDVQLVHAGKGNNMIEQDGGTGDDHQHVSVGGGHNVVHQSGGKGDDVQTVRVYGHGHNDIHLDGGSGDDVQEVVIHGGGTNRILVDGGSGNDIIRVTGGTGDDHVTILAGPGNDHVVYTVSPGNDVVQIDGGGQRRSRDSATIHVGRENVTIRDEAGQILFRQGQGGTVITLKNIQELAVIGPNGESLI